MISEFIIRKTNKFTAIRCRSCNQTRTFAGEDLTEQLENFRLEHSHQAKEFNQDRFVNKIIGRFGE